MYISRFKALALSGIAAAIFIGCGGGDSGPAATGSTLSGTAAGGVAIIGNVIVKDSLGVEKGGTIDSTGHYNVDVSGMTGPFTLKASGKVGNTTVTYFSAATSTDVGGTINITPFTNLILSNLVGQIAENYFANHNASLAMINTAALATQETALQAKLQLVFSQLGIDSAIDLLRSSFTADHSGMDAVMDLIKVDIDPTSGIASIKNAITQAVISTDDLTSKSDDATPVDSAKIAGLTTGAVTDLQAVTAAMNGFARLYANGTPSETTITNSGLFDTTSAFMDRGRSFGEFATQMSTDQFLIGITFSNIDILLTSPTTATLTAEVHFANGSNPDMISLQMKKVGATWFIIGDQHLADMDIVSQAVYQPQNSALPIRNGLKFWISPFAYNATHSTAMVTSALITGPGLVNGVTMTQGGGEGLGISGGASQIIECSNTQSQPCVTIADVKDDSVYHIVLKDTNNNVLEDFNQTIHKAPVATSKLSAANFPIVTSTMLNGVPMTTANWSQLIAGATLKFTWTLPASYTSDYLSASASTNTGQYYRLQKDFAPTDTQTTFTLGSGDITGTGVTGASVWLSARDAYNREFVYSGWMQ